MPASAVARPNLPGQLRTSGPGDTTDRSHTSGRGRTRILPRALTRVVSAVAAGALGVDSSRVSVELGDDDGNLALVVSTPIRVVSLTRVTREPGAVERSGGTVLERCARAQDEIRTTVGAITGSTIARVTIRVTGADIRQEERVK